MVRIVLRWIDSSWAFELLPGLNRLGRNPTNDFRVSDPSVSSFHAELTVRGEEIYVRDLGSTNGTFIDEQRIEEGTLKPENVLRLGNIHFKLEEVSVTPVASQPVADTAAAAPPVELSTMCIYHGEQRAAYKCENCGAAVCESCLTVVGQDKFEATTICPVCKGQCYPLPHPSEKLARPPSLLHRLTQTLRIPFSH